MKPARKSNRKPGKAADVPLFVCASGRHGMVERAWLAALSYSRSLLTEAAADPHAGSPRLSAKLRRLQRSHPRP